MTEVPEGDWFCSVCVSRVGREAAPHPPGPAVTPAVTPIPFPQAGEYRDPISPRRGKKRKRGRLFAGRLREEEEEESPRRRPASRRREGLPVPRYAGEGLSPAKRRGATLRGHNSDLTFCE